MYSLEARNHDPLFCVYYYVLSCNQRCCDFCKVTILFPVRRVSDSLPHFNCFSFLRAFSYAVLTPEIKRVFARTQTRVNYGFQNGRYPGYRVYPGCIPYCH